MGARPRGGGPTDPPRAGEPRAGERLLTRVAAEKRLEECGCFPAVGGGGFVGGTAAAATPRPPRDRPPRPDIPVWKKLRYFNGFSTRKMRGMKKGKIMFLIV